MEQVIQTNLNIFVNDVDLGLCSLTYLTKTNSKNHEILNKIL